MHIIYMIGRIPLPHQYYVLGIIHYFQHLCKSTLGEEVNPVLHFKNVDLIYTVPVYEASLANQHFIVCFGVASI